MLLLVVAVIIVIIVIIHILISQADEKLLRAPEFPDVGVRDD